MKTQISQPRLGFTLIELLVVIGVIAVLSSILIPVLGEAKSKARAIKCISNKKQLVNAWHLYSTDNDGWLILNGETNVSVERIPAEKIFGLILGYLEESLSDNILQILIFRSLHIQT